MRAEGEVRGSRPARRAGAAAGRPARAAAAPLRTKAYEAIKRRIISLRYRPGAYLNAAQVSEELGLGRTPVSQALSRLMHEGMVDVIPRKGAIVRPVSLEEILAIIEARLVNETHCVRVAAERASDGEIAGLEEICSRAEALTRSRDVEALMLLDREFHIRLSRASRNPVLAEMLLSLHERSLRFWFVSLSDEKHLEAVQREHRAIVDRLRARDADGIAAAMRAHIESFRATIARSL
jgi:DNA-binding GntR family transcriptional regulator